MYRSRRMCQFRIKVLDRELSLNYVRNSAKGVIYMSNSDGLKEIRRLSIFGRKTDLTKQEQKIR